MKIHAIKDSISSLPQLDLSKVIERNEQLRRIKAWGRLGVREG
jgi:hypothetical protein